MHEQFLVLYIPLRGWQNKAGKTFTEDCADLTLLNFKSSGWATRHFMNTCGRSRNLATSKVSILCDSS